MSNRLCLHCGSLHSLKNMKQCSNIGERTCSGKKAGKALMVQSHDVSPEQAMSEDMSVLSLMKCKQQTIADIAHVELEERTLNLEEKHVQLMMAHT